LQKQSSDINTNIAAIEELRKAIKKQPLQYKKVGQVFFGSGATQLSETSKANLDAVLQTLQDSKNKGNEIQVFIQGNASTDGDPQRNMELSMRRAAQVRQYLVNKGLDASLVKVVPLGEEDPNKGSAGSSKGEAGDRRVDIIFTEKPKKGRL
jgi:outer membrane protein OmpA-like peptidoglycan-associated protein